MTNIILFAPTAALYITVRQHLIVCKLADNNLLLFTQTSLIMHSNVTIFTTITDIASLASVPSLFYCICLFQWDHYPTTRILQDQSFFFSDFQIFKNNDFLDFWIYGFLYSFWISGRISWGTGRRTTREDRAIPLLICEALSLAIRKKHVFFQTLPKKEGAVYPYKSPLNWYIFNQN